MTLSLADMVLTAFDSSAPLEPLERPWQDLPLLQITPNFMTYVLENENGPVPQDKPGLSAHFHPYHPDAACPNLPHLS